MCKLKNYICYSVSIPCDMPFSDIYDRVISFCEHEVNVGRFQEYLLVECADYIQVYVRGGSKRDWKMNFEDCLVCEILYSDFVGIIKVMTEIIGEPLYYKKTMKGDSKKWKL